MALGSLLDDQHWHSVLLEHARQHMTLSVDRHSRQFQARGQLSHADLDPEVQSLCQSWQGVGFECSVAWTEGGTLRRNALSRHMWLGLNCVAREPLSWAPSEPDLERGPLCSAWPTAHIQSH